MIYRAILTFERAPIWVLRIVFALAALLTGTGVIGYVVYQTYDPHSMTQVAVRNETNQDTAVSWDSETPNSLPAGRQSRFEGAIGPHTVEISSVGDDGLRLEIAIASFYEYGDELTIDLSQAPAGSESLP